METKDTIPCVAAVIEREGCVLLGLRHYDIADEGKTVSVWTTPGGKCEGGEDMEDALCREVREEIGVEDVIIHTHVGTTRTLSDKYHVHIYQCTINGEPRNMEPDNFSQWRWIHKDEIPVNFVNPHMLRIIQGER